MSEWVTTITPCEEKIEDFSKSILSNPAATVSVDNVEKPVYTMSQMLDMFRAGIYYISSTSLYPIYSGNSKKAPYGVLKQMGVGESALFPYSKWKSVRVSASKLRELFGCKFKCNKQSKYGEEGVIKVTRIE